MGVLVAQFYLVFVLMIIPTMIYATSGRHSLEVQNLLKRLNKPSVKSIKSPDGDIIDCVHIYNQPALDHPLLKNHTIQMRPSSFPKEDPTFLRESKEGSVEQLWQSKGRCPEGTIPIRRVSKQDILRAGSIRKFGMKKNRTIPMLVGNSQDPNLEYAEAFVQGDKYYGAKAAINNWEPIVEQPNEFSASQISIGGGPYDNINTIEVGWHVLPNLYNDNKTRLFIYWTSDGYKSTGCYNLLCSGFVQTSKEIAVGASLTPISIYGDKASQYDFTLFVWKDPKDGNWWLSYGDGYGDGKLMGYWPASLFTDLKDSASGVQWGGAIVNLKVGGKHTTTQMGSGHFPGEGFGKASYFRNLQIIDINNTLLNPQGITTANDTASCYNIDLHKGDFENWGTYFYYGGPGRNPNCQ